MAAATEAVSAAERAHRKIRSADARCAEGSDGSATATHTNSASATTADVDAATTASRACPATASAATASTCGPSIGRSLGDQQRHGDEQNDRNTDGRPKCGAWVPHGAALPDLLIDF
jgi:hypothetical protein